MSRSLGNVIADSLGLGLGYAERLMVDVRPDQFAKFASTGRSLIQSNHPAFILGHLSLYAPEIIGHLGADASSVEPSERFQTVFSKDATCEHDEEGTVYPSQDEVTKVFFDGYRAAREHLQAADDAVMQQPNPMDGRMAELFPTIGSLLAFYSGGHFMLHMGQLSAWRRMMGMGAA